MFRLARYLGTYLVRLLVILVFSNTVVLSIRGGGRRGLVGMSEVFEKVNLVTKVFFQ